MGSQIIEAEFHIIQDCTGTRMAHHEAWPGVKGVVLSLRLVEDGDDG